MVARGVGRWSCSPQHGSQMNRYAGDHKGPPNPSSSALAPTDCPALCLAFRIRFGRPRGLPWKSNRIPGDHSQTLVLLHMHLSILSPLCYTHPWKNCPNQSIKTTRRDFIARRGASAGKDGCYAYIACTMHALSQFVLSAGAHLFLAFYWETANLGYRHSRCWPGGAYHHGIVFLAVRAQVRLVSDKGDGDAEA